MELGIISDTHGLVRPEVYEQFDGVDLILHAGDIGGMDVIIELEAIAPVKAVAGNVDADLFEHLPEHRSFELENRLIHLQHILSELPGENESSESPVNKIVIFGHSHTSLNQKIGDTLFFNPGSAGPRRFRLPITVGRITLGPEGVTRRIIRLDKSESAA